MAGGVVQSLNAYDSSTVTINGGFAGMILSARDFSTVTMNSGSIIFLAASESSTATVSGGNIASSLWASHSSQIWIIGFNFAVDGIPVPYGDLAAPSGTLTGTLASGDSLNNVFYQGGYVGSPCSVEDPCSGTITLVRKHACCNTGEVGCIDPAIEAAVCAVDPFCCAFSWDSFCVGEVISVFGDNCDCCLTSSSAEGCFDATTGNAISDCVCAIDPCCCQVRWDSICVDEVESLGCGSDSDDDGISACLDSCIDVPNGPLGGSCYVGGVQIDGNQDGYGNPCDMDFKNDLLHTGADVAPGNYLDPTGPYPPDRS